MQEQATSFTAKTESAEQTEQLGRQLGLLLEAGAVVTLAGELGGGKTCFVRGIVAGAAPESLQMVASPTFAILNEYPGPCALLHYDCYRLRGCDDAIELGLEDHLHGSGICLIEWPERIRAILPANRIEVSFEYIDDHRRRILLIPHGPDAVATIKQLAATVGSCEKNLV